MAASHLSYGGPLTVRAARLVRGTLIWAERLAWTVFFLFALTVLALRYVVLNPVRAKLCDKPEQWPWSSARTYLKGRDDGLTQTADMLTLCPDIKTLVAETPEQEMAEMLLRRAESIGRPLGSVAFLERLERKLDRPLKAAKRGPKPSVKKS